MSTYAQSARAQAPQQDTERPRGTVESDDQDLVGNAAVAERLGVNTPGSPGAGQDAEQGSGQQTAEGEGQESETGPGAVTVRNGGIIVAVYDHNPQNHATSTCSRCQPRVAALMAEGRTENQARAQARQEHLADEPMPNDIAEFERMALDFVSDHNAMPAIPVTHKDQVASGIRAALDQARAETGDPELLVSTVAFFAHGFRDSLKLGTRIGVMQVSSFVSGIQAMLTNDVVVANYACDTGQGPGDGAGSFSDTMHDALVDQGHTEATVMGHTSPAHVTNSPDLRLFEGSSTQGGGQHLSTIIFPESYARQQLEQDGVPTTAGNVTWLRQKMALFCMSAMQGERARDFALLGEAERQAMIEQVRAEWPSSQHYRDYEQRTRAWRR
ncbi:MAG: hypothetical protein H6739_21640 [Alphaproteobacteria bacterium]|nr:hypothetical protein [Alphaproteobacteria bacterium]